MTRPQARWDMGPVLTLWNGRSIVDLALQTGITRRQLERWLRSGVPDRSADRLGTALGCGPEALWPEWYAGVGSPEIVDHIAAGVVREADRRRRASLASGSAKTRAALIAASRPDPDQENAIAPDPPVNGAAGPLARPIARSNGHSDDLVYIFPEWLANSADPPGLPPRKEDAVLCECSLTDGIGRPLHIGWCCRDNCERRPA